MASSDLMSIPGFKLRVETMGKMTGREGFVPYQMWSDRFGEEGNFGTNSEALLDRGAL